MYKFTRKQKIKYSISRNKELKDTISMLEGEIDLFNYAVKFRTIEHDKLENLTFKQHTLIQRLTK